MHTAAAEVGQGLVTVQQQIARTELGVQRVVLHVQDTAVAPAPALAPQFAELPVTWKQT